MKWVIQTNIYAEEGFESLITALDRLSLPRTLVKVVPFVGRLEPVEGELPERGERAIVMGSYTLARVARKMEWTPGAFLDNLDFLMQRNFWGSHSLVNGDASVCRMYEVPRELYGRYIHGPFFIRPYGDTKSFAGMVTDYEGFTAWLNRLFELRDQGEDSTVTPDTLVMVGPKKEIYSETRVWIVDGQVVTASGYKVGTLKRYTPPEMVDERITEFAQGKALHWSPNEAYVMDVAEVEHGHLKIIEVNNLNSAGFYRGDMNRLVQALQTLGENGPTWNFRSHR